jgi:hypothetical protein
MEGRFGVAKELADRGANTQSGRCGQVKAGATGRLGGAEASAVELSRGGSCNFARDHGAGAGLAVVWRGLWRCGPAEDAG